MKNRSYIVTLAACAVAALGTSAAQAHLLAGNSSYGQAKASQNTLNAMLKVAAALSGLAVGGVATWTLLLAPLVVVQPEISPFSFNAEQCMVPVGGNNTFRIASQRCSGCMPTSAARRSIFCKPFSQLVEGG